MRVLLAALACVFLTGAFAQTPEERLFEAIEDDKPLVAEGIVARGKVNLDARNKDRETALHRAIEKGYKELAAMLVRAGAPLGALTQTGETPLHYAALYAETDFMELLLDGKPGSKADVRARNDDGESVLQWAVMSGNAATARLLLERGADPKAVDLKGNTLLHAAADGGYAALASAFLGLGVDPRQRNREGKRPIQIGRERGHAEIVKLLERFEKE